MTTTRKLFTFSFVILAFLSLYFLANTSLFETNSSRLSNLITIDVLLTIPFVYFLFIRKSDISKLTIIPVTIAGLVLASCVIPQEHQTVLSFVKTWILPIVEVGMLSFVIYKVVTTIKSFKQNKTADSDFYTVLKNTCSTHLPKFVASVLAMEVSVIYYGLINWKKRQLKSNEFTYHKNSGSITLFVAFIFVIGIETFVLHILLYQSYPILAWILTILSIYTGIQLFGFAKSILKQPIALENDMLYLRYGIMKALNIGLNDIDAVEITTRVIEENPEIKHLSLLGSIEGHNMILHFKNEQYLHGIYGTKKEVKSLALSIDDAYGFRKMLEAQISESEVE